MVTYSVHPEGCTIRWTRAEVKYTPEYYIVHYRQRRFPYVSSEVLNETRYVLDGLSSDIDYYYYVEVSNSVGSVYSNVHYFRTSSSKLSCMLKQ